MKTKGFIAIDKPKSWTSFDVVNKIKHMIKPLKVGHLGTLDPMATGVMLVSIGKATKLFDFMQEKLKTYIAEFEFGYSTDTLDATGNIISRTDKIPTTKEIESVIKNQIGKISQIPPKYSAKSINGKRAYDLARNGQKFELSPKIVYVKEINIISYSNRILKVEIICGSGTYIRSICRDIAENLGSLATMISLVRTQIDAFKLTDCSRIEDLSIDNIDSNILKIDDVIKIDELKLDNDKKIKLLNGQTLKTGIKSGVFKLKDENDVVAIIKINDFTAKMSIFLG